MSSQPIPPCLHLFWMDRPPGRQELACLRTVRHHHPHWRITVHGEGFSPAWEPVARLAELKPLDWLEPDVRCLFDRCGGASLRSDVVRYAALRRWGGVWLDFDVVCLRPFDELCRAGGFAGSESFGVIGTSVIGARPEDGVVRRALQLIPAWLDPEDRLSIGPRLLTRAVLDCGTNWLILEPEGFYPWRWSQVGRFPPRQDLVSSFAVHLCGSLGPVDGPAWDLLVELAPAFGRGDDDD